MGHWQDWANLVLGIWPILSPWSLGFCGMTSAMGNAVIVGCIVEP
jgi:hypothetical protein